MSQYSSKRKKRPYADDDGKNGAVGGQILTLSLFIMLLAFFIILTSVSQLKEEKIRPIIESIEDTFASTVAQTESAPSMEIDPAKSIYSGHAFDRLQNLFETEIPSFRFRRNDKDGTMVMRVREDYFVQAMNIYASPDDVQKAMGEGRYMPARGFFIPLLVDIMNNKNANDRYDLTLTVFYKNNPAKSAHGNDPGLEARMRRASSYVERLIDQGMPASLLAVAVDEGDTTYMDLYFRPHVRYDPLTGAVLDGK